MPTARKAALWGSSNATYVDLHFSAGSYRVGRTGANDIAQLPGWSFTRASSATYFGSDGLLQTAGSGVVRLVYDPVTLASLGILVEESRTNIALYNRDLTNAAWVKTTMSTALTQTGIDGVANSASLITATAPGAMVVQTVVLASSTRQQSAYVKRITGSGTVNMSTDGVTWVAVTVTADWTRVTIPAQAAVVNPVFGFQLATSGDAIAVDFVQNEAGTGASSAIATTTAAVTRAADDAILTGLSVSGDCTVMWEGRMPSFITSDARSALSDGSLNNRLLALANTSTAFAEVNAGGGAVLSGSGVAVSGVVKLAIRSSGGSYGRSINGSAEVTASGATMGVLTQLDVGRNSASASRYWNSTFSRIRIYNRALSDAQLQSLST